MPFNELQRRDSWPPTILRIREQEAEVIDPIDANPFAFFLTSPEDIDDDLEDLSAGIENDHDPKPRVREISPSGLQRAPLEDGEDNSFRLGFPLSLRDFNIIQHKPRESREGLKESTEGPKEGLEPPEFSVRRGRATARLTSSLRSGRGRGQTRSLSARRPHSWREPSPDVWPITEERESDDGDADQQESKASTSDDTTNKTIPIPKPKKRVHWAF